MYVLQLSDFQVLQNICRFALFPGVDVFLTCILHFHLGQSISNTTASMLKIAFSLLTWEMTHAESYSTPLPACTPLSLAASDTRWLGQLTSSLQTESHQGQKLNSDNILVHTPAQCTSPLQCHTYHSSLLNTSKPFFFYPYIFDYVSWS